MRSSIRRDDSLLEIPPERCPAGHLVRHGTLVGWSHAPALLGAAGTDRVPLPRPGGRRPLRSSTSPSHGSGSPQTQVKAKNAVIKPKWKLQLAPAGPVTAWHIADWMALNQHR